MRVAKFSRHRLWREPSRRESEDWNASRPEPDMTIRTHRRRESCWKHPESQYCRRIRCWTDRSHINDNPIASAHRPASTHNWRAFSRSPFNNSCSTRFRHYLYNMRFHKWGDEKRVKEWNLQYKAYILGDIVRTPWRVNSYIHLFVSWVFNIRRFRFHHQVLGNRFNENRPDITQICWLA